jgi:dienelactone hydrolase
MQWPDNEDYSLQFMRVLGAAQEGGSTVSECFLTASRIVPGDDESWYRAWTAVADSNKARGDAALEAGHLHSALGNWLRASNYYRAAEVFLKLDDGRRADALERMRASSYLVVSHQPSGGELVRIPCFDDGFVEAYFLPAPGATKSPVVICVGGPGHFKDEHLHTLMRQARARGLSLLLADLPGQGAAPRIKGLVRYEIETAISCCVDYLIARGDIDEQRIAIFGDGLGAAYASRAAGLDDRFAAAVCDAGIWDMHQSVTATQWMSGHDGHDAIADEIGRLRRHGGLISIKCPILMIFGEHDWLDVRHAIALSAALRDEGADVTLRIFAATETAAAHGQSDNPTLGNEFVFDWIASRLAIVPASEPA